MADAPAEIEFSQPDEEPYGCFSNYYMRPLQFAGSRYPSAEHAYHAQRARRPEVREWVARAPTPQLAAAAGDGLPPDEAVPDWPARQTTLMADILQAKFTQHRDLCDLLLLTRDAPLAEIAAEDNPTNRFWSKVNGEGRNMLGFLLMELRGRLRGSQAQ
jgi:ribA/ribD-fused uncharacterized protein